MENKHFIEQVAGIAGEATCNEHVHMINDINQVYHFRYLHTLELGFTIPEATHHVITAGQLPEVNYMRYIKYQRLIKTMMEAYEN